MLNLKNTGDSGIFSREQKELVVGLEHALTDMELHPDDISQEALFGLLGDSSTKKLHSKPSEFLKEQVKRHESVNKDIISVSSRIRHLGLLLVKNKNHVKATQYKLVTDKLKVASTTLNTIKSDFTSNAAITVHDRALTSPQIFEKKIPDGSAALAQFKTRAIKIKKAIDAAGSALKALVKKLDICEDAIQGEPGISVESIDLSFEAVEKEATPKEDPKKEEKPKEEGKDTESKEEGKETNTDKSDTKKKGLLKRVIDFIVNLWNTIVKAVKSLCSTADSDIKEAEDGLNDSAVAAAIDKAAKGSKDNDTSDKTSNEAATASTNLVNIPHELVTTILGLESIGDQQGKVGSLEQVVAMANKLGKRNFEIRSIPLNTMKANDLKKHLAVLRENNKSANSFIGGSTLSTTKTAISNAKDDGKGAFVSKAKAATQLLIYKAQSMQIIANAVGKDASSVVGLVRKHKKGSSNESMSLDEASMEGIFEDVLGALDDAILEPAVGGGFRAIERFAETTSDAIDDVLDFAKKKHGTLSTKAVTAITKLVARVQRKKHNKVLAAVKAEYAKGNCPTYEGFGGPTIDFITAVAKKKNIKLRWRVSGMRDKSHPDNVGIKYIYDNSRKELKEALTKKGGGSTESADIDWINVEVPSLEESTFDVIMGIMDKAHENFSKFMDGISSTEMATAIDVPPEDELVAHIKQHPHMARDFFKRFISDMEGLCKSQSVCASTLRECIGKATGKQVNKLKQDAAKLKQQMVHNQQVLEKANKLQALANKTDGIKPGKAAPMPGKFARLIDKIRATNKQHAMYCKTVEDLKARLTKSSLGHSMTAGDPAAVAMANIDTLSDKAFGISSERRHPLCSCETINIAIASFESEDRTWKPELAASIVSAAEYFGVSVEDNEILLWAKQNDTTGIWSLEDANEGEQAADNSKDIDKLVKVYKLPRAIAKYIAENGKMGTVNYGKLRVAMNRGVTSDDLIHLWEGKLSKDRLVAVRKACKGVGGLGV